MMGNLEMIIQLAAIWHKGPQRNQEWAWPLWWNLMLMEWVAWSPDRETQEFSWSHSERGCVTLWVKWTIPSSGHEGNEFLSTHPLRRWKASHFMKDEHGGKAIHPKLSIEVHLIGRVIITSIEHQSKSRIKKWTLIHLIWLASIDNRGYECEFISLDSIGKAWGWIS